MTKRKKKVIHETPREKRISKKDLVRSANTVGRQRAAEERVERRREGRMERPVRF